MISDRKISNNDHNNDNCSNDDDDDNSESNHCVYSLSSQGKSNNNNNNNNDDDIIIINGDSSLRGCRENLPATLLGRYHCQQCDSVFADSTALHHHHKSLHSSSPLHSSLRSSSQHSCPECRKNFSSSSGLKQHQHIHQTVKPFRCDVCLKAYTQFSNLCRHKRMHADCRQQIHCRDCLQAFSTLMSLNKHRRFCDGGGGRATKAPTSQPPPVAASSSSSPAVLPLGFSIPGVLGFDGRTGPPALAIRPGPLGPVESCWMHLYGCRGGQNAFPACSPAYIAACMPPFAAAAAAQSVLSAAAHSSLLGQYMGFLHREEEGKASSSSSSSDNEDKVKVKGQGKVKVRSLASKSSVKSPNGDVRDDDVTDAVEIKKDPEVGDVKVTSVSDVIVGGAGMTLKNDVDDDDTEGDDMTSSASPRHDVTQSAADQSDFVEGPLDLRVSARKERESASPGHGPDRASSSGSGSFQGSKTFDSGTNFPGLLFSSSDHRANHHLHHHHHHQHHHLPRKSRHLAPHGTPFPPSSTLHRLRKDLIKSFTGALYHQPTVTEETQDRHHLLSTVPAATIRGGLRGAKAPLVASLVRLPDILSMKSTSTAKPKYRYSCRYCGKVFPRSANLTRHLRTHTGEQPYRCKYCKRCFSISSNLQRHVRNIHNKERPFRCPLCDRCFGQQTNLDRHVKKHDADLDPIDPADSDPCFAVPEYLVGSRSTREGRDFDQQQQRFEDVQRYFGKANHPPKRFCQGQGGQGQGQDKEAEEDAEEEREGGSPDCDLSVRELKTEHSVIGDSEAKVSK